MRIKGRTSKLKKREGLIRLTALHSFLYCLAVLLVVSASGFLSVTFLAGAILGVTYLLISIWFYKIAFGTATGEQTAKNYIVVASLLKLPLLLIVLYLLARHSTELSLGFVSGLLVHLSSFVHYTLRYREDNLSIPR